MTATPRHNTDRNRSHLSCLHGLRRLNLAANTLAVLLTALCALFAIPAMAQQGFSPAGNLANARSGHTATLLLNGRVIVTGGTPFFNGARLTSAELYDPVANTWSVAASLATPRDGHTATLLRNGKLLVVGGYSNAPVGGARTATVELYDATTDTWSAAASLVTGRGDHTATLLANGKVLVVAGFTNGGYTAGAELYDPETDTWSYAGSVRHSRIYHAATLLANGNVLVAGGLNPHLLATVDLYNPATNTWSALPDLSGPRQYLSATLLTNGKVLVAGGSDALFAELYDPGTNTWSATASMSTRRINHDATLLPSGKVLVSWGGNRSCCTRMSAELYDPVANAWADVGSQQPQRQRRRATLLPNGYVLMVGGVEEFSTYLASAERYDLLNVVATASTYQIHTIAGNGTGGFSGDGGQAANALVSSPLSIVFDSAGNLLFADGGNNTVRKITPAGVISTIAGNGVAGFAGDGGPAAAATLSAPFGLAIDGGGNLYVADFGNNRVRKITPAGVITTIAGDGTDAAGGDGGQATAAQIGSISGLAVDVAGNLYITQRFYNRVRKVTPAGVISTIAGTGVAGSTGDNGQATSAQLNFPIAVAVSAAGEVYVAERDGHRVRRITTAGVISTIAGTGVAGFSGDNGQATVAQLNNPAGVYVSATGEIYISDRANYRLRKIATNGVITTIAGNGSVGTPGDGGPAVAANINEPSFIAFDAAGNLYIPERSGARVRKVTMAVPDAPTITGVVSGSGQVTINFTPALSNGGSPVTSYTASCGTLSASGTGSPIIISGLTGGVAVTCYVRASNLLGGGAISTGFTSVTPQAGPQTIVFGAAPIVFANVANVVTTSTGSLSATGGGSNNPVVFTSTTPTICTVSGTDGATVTGVNTGTCIIAANQAGNATYLLAPQVSQSFTVWQRRHLAASDNHTLAIRADGTLWSWGSNTSGQLGIGSTTSSTVAVQIGSSTNWVSVAAGTSHSGALRADGTLWMWGANVSGQLGTFTTNSTATSPDQVGVGADWTALTAGSDHTIALKSDGTLWGWGNSAFRQLGINNSAVNRRPLQIGTATNWGVVAAGEYHTLAIQTNGTLWGWGDNQGKQVSNVVALTIDTPTQLDATTNWRTIAGGFRHSLGIRTDGTLWGWGVVGNGSTSTTIGITQSGTASNWVNIAATNNHSLGIQSDGSLWSWGEHYFGALGSGLADGVYPTPAQVGTALAWRAVAAGRYNSLALRVDSGEVSAWGWGANSSGMTGDGTITSRAVPTQSLTAPLIGTATTSNGSVTVAFTALAATFNSLTGYIATSMPGNITGSCIAPCSSINVSGLTLGSSYTFTVAATNAAGFGRASVASNGVIPPTVSDAPVIGVATAGVSQVTVVFTPPSNNRGSAITGYTATCGANSSSGAGSPIIVTGLVIASVTCSVVAINAVGTSAPSAQSNSVTPLGVPQLITFGAAPTLGFGASGVLSASGGASGNPVVFTSLTPAVCTVSGVNGATVTGVSLGTCIIAANQAGNANFAAAAQVTQSFGVGSGTQVVIFGAAPTVIFGGTGSVTATGGASGNPVTFTSLTTSTCLVSGNTVSGVAAGVCTVQASQAGNTNYNSATAQQSFNINKANQVISFQPQAIFFGLTTTLQASGGASGNAITFTSSTPAVCAVSGTNGATVLGTGVGACSLTANQAGNSNYNAAAAVSITFYTGRSGGSETLAVGTNHAIALQINGLSRTLWAWGYNAFGSLGDGSTTDRSSPVQIGSATLWATISAGENHSLALQTDGTLWAWGYNFLGQLGNGTTANQLNPTQIGNVTTWVAASGGKEHSAALRADGTLWTWGGNGYAQLGDGTSTNSSAPMQVGSATNWVAVSAGGRHTLALRADGTLWAWGDNSFKQLGDGTTTQRATPIQIGNASNWLAVSAGLTHSVALRRDGSLWMWGTIGATSQQWNSPTQIGTVTNWTAIKAADQSDFALRDDGTAWAWGVGSSGQLGNGDTLNRANPTQVTGSATWSSISARGSFTAAQRADGTFWTWGSSSFGTLGDGTNVDRAVPGMALPAPVIGVATAGAGGSGTANVTFTPLGPTLNPVTGYKAVSTPGNLTGTCVAPCSSIMVAGLTSGTAYTFAIAATNLAGSGALSNGVTFSGITQTITFGTAPTINFGGTGTVTATGGASGNAVVFTANTTNVCTVSGLNGKTVTGVAAGTCTIAANQAGDPNYAPATQVTQSIVINKVNQATLTATAAATTLVEDNTATLGSTGGSGTGAVTFSSNNGNCTISGSVLTAVSVGTCVVTATKAADTNYNQVTSAGLTFTVNASALPIQTITFGTAPSVAVGGTGAVGATGGASGNAVVFTSATTGVCTVGGANGSTVTGVSVGTCTIAANQAGNASYRAAPQATLSFALLGETWTATGSMSVARTGHTLTKLNDGRVLAVGGYYITVGTSIFVAVASAELYNPATGTWTAAASLSGARFEHTATLLADGSVLVVGGRDGDQATTNTVARYDPVTNTWSAVAPMQADHTAHTATLLANGKVLVVGGISDLSTELYDPATNNWTSGPNLPAIFSRHTATRLATGSVLIAGGDTGGLASCLVMLYTPQTNTVSLTASFSTQQCRYGHTSTLLADNRVLLAAGGDVDYNFYLWDSAFAYDATTNNWQARASIGSARSFHTANLLGSGKVLIAGGINDSFGDTASARVYSIQSDAWTSTTNLITARSRAASVLLNDGRVLVAGGLKDGYALASAELYSDGTANPPSIGTATAGNASATVTFTAPSGQGVTSVTATSSPGGLSASCNMPCNSIVVSGLTNGTAYTFTVTATNVIGTSFASAASNSVTPMSNIALTAVQSRRTHGAAGTFDLLIDTAPLIGGAVTVEPRVIGAGHRIVFQFNQAVTSIGTVTATDVGGSPIGVANGLINSGNLNEVIVTLTGVVDASRVLVTLNGVNGILNMSAAIGFLVGDVNNSRSVTNADLTTIKTRAGQTLDNTNFKYDVNVSGGITNTDITSAKSRSGAAI